MTACGRAWQRRSCWKRALRSRLRRCCFRSYSEQARSHQRPCCCFRSCSNVARTRHWPGCSCRLCSKRALRSRWPCFCPLSYWSQCFVAIGRVVASRRIGNERLGAGGCVAGLRMGDRTCKQGDRGTNDVDEYLQLAIHFGFLRIQSFHATGRFQGKSPCSSCTMPGRGEVYGGPCGGNSYS